MIKSEGVQVGVSSRLLVLLNSNTQQTFTAKILLKLFLSNLLHPLKLKAPTMILSNSTVFKITLIPQWTYFLLVRKIRPFLHEKVVIAQSDACRWFYAPIYAKWLPLINGILFSLIQKLFTLAGSFPIDLFFMIASYKGLEEDVTYWLNLFYRAHLVSYHKPRGRACQRKHLI